MRIAEYQDSKIALGGTVTIGFTAELDGKAAASLMRNLWLEVFLFEKRFSRFLPSSELSRFNRQAGRMMEITPAFEDILKTSKMLGSVTKGVFNPFVLPALQRAGYKQSALPGHEDDSVDSYTNRTGASVSELKVQTGRATIPFGTAIDLGGCGKGYLADRLGDRLRESGVDGYWVNLSGDIATYGTDIDGLPMAVAVDDTDVIAVSPSVRFGIATSGTKQRAGQKLKGHHIIDPRTFSPAETTIVRATVTADSAVLADVLASCAIIVGIAQAPEYLKAAGALDWLLQYIDDDGVMQTIIQGKHMKQPEGAAHA